MVSDSTSRSSGAQALSLLQLGAPIETFENTGMGGLGKNMAQRTRSQQSTHGTSISIILYLHSEKQAELSEVKWILRGDPGFKSRFIQLQSHAANCSALKPGSGHLYFHPLSIHSFLFANSIPVVFWRGIQGLSDAVLVGCHSGDPQPWAKV